MVPTLRERGARIAVDDVGEGYAGLQRVMAMSPDLLKLDRSLVTGVEAEPAKRPWLKRSFATPQRSERRSALKASKAWTTSTPCRPRRGGSPRMGHRNAVRTFEEVSEASRLTCESSFARALAVGGEERTRHATEP